MNNFRFYNENVLVSSDGLVSVLNGRYKGISNGHDNGDGYRTKSINKRTWRIHDLVWFVFKGEIPDGYVVHHINGQKDDNRLENLQLMSRSEHMSMHNSGENHPKYGTHLSKETKQKISKSHIGKHHSEETKQKLSEQGKGRTHTDEHIKNSAIGHYKPVKQIPLDGSPEIVWDSATTAAKTLNIGKCCICECCKGNMKTYKKSKWEYV